MDPIPDRSTTAAARLEWTDAGGRRDSGVALVHVRRYVLHASSRKLCLNQHPFACLSLVATCRSLHSFRSGSRPEGIRVRMLLLTMAAQCNARSPRFPGNSNLPRPSNCAPAPGGHISTSKSLRHGPTTFCIPQATTIHVLGRRERYGNQ